jgi:hypothetical protein
MLCKFTFHNVAYYHNTFITEINVIKTQFLLIQNVKYSYYPLHQRI